MSGTVPTLPALSCDAHTHVFDARFPTALPSAYPLPDAPFTSHRRNLEANGLARGVLIQPAPYGQDAAAMIDALGASEGRLRGVASATPDVGDQTLAVIQGAGIRALRFLEARTPAGERYPGSVGADALAPLAQRMAALGWHAELWSPLDETLKLWPGLERLNLPVVLDHMGGFDAVRGVEDPSFQRLLAMVREGQVWIKLTLCRRAPFGSDFSELRPFHDALVAANPDRMLWGSDWPFVRMGEHAPTTAHVLELFLKWVDDPQLRQRILADNPAARYDFQPGD
jgi:2-pyrone-4,6-dicarboxylate lactonase